MSVYAGTPDGLKLYQGDVREELRRLPDGLVHACVTSPPYYGLRAYDGAISQVWEPDTRHGHRWEVEFSACEHEWASGSFCKHCHAWQGSYGQEPSVSLYVWHTVLICREIARVLRNDATLWWNVGDSFSGGGGPAGGQGQTGQFGGQHKYNNQKARAGDPSVPTKNLLMVPFQVAIALQQDGWILRQTIIWEKPAPMPESVQDRPTTSHEYIFMLAKKPQYYFDAMAVRVQGDPAQTEHNNKYAHPYYRAIESAEGGVPGAQNNQGMHSRPGPGGHNIGSVWTFGYEPSSDSLCESCGAYYRGAVLGALKKKKLPDGKTVRLCRCGSYAWVAHFAAFPSTIPRNVILAGTSEHGVCTECCAPYQRVTERVDAEIQNPRAFAKEGNDDRNDTGRIYSETIIRTVGWRPVCSCSPRAVEWVELINKPKLTESEKKENERRAALRAELLALYATYPTLPATVLDPFAGSGTTLLVARRLGRRGIGIDLSEPYLRLTGHRLTEIPLSMFSLPDAPEPQPALL